MSMIDPSRMYFTIIYVGSMFATLYFTFSFGGVSGYMMVMAASGAQLLALVWYLVSFLPGGTTGLKYISAVLGHILKPVFVVCTRIQTYFITKCFGWATGSSST